jgi:hypothetical protein
MSTLTQRKVAVKEEIASPPAVTTDPPENKNDDKSK